MTPAMLSRALAPLTRRMRLMVSRGVVRVVDDALKRQNLQVVLLSDEVANVERFQDYGFTSVPPLGSEAVVLSVGGTRSHLLAVAVGSRADRLRDLAPGDVAAYHPDGARVHLQAGARLDVTGDDVRLGAPDASKAVALAPDVESELSKLVTGVNNLIVAFNTHVQPTPMGPTGVPFVPAVSLATPGPIAAAQVKAK